MLSIVNIFIKYGLVFVSNIEVWNKEIDWLIDWLIV